ncbi:hypothetical protein FA13DRAFT_1792164 [Coprinellus micaceus]|uniref:Uncharacterized protein n=1 Tax=Coprinellus micaceus TaxID=71717 RepID=A0A4Y7T8T4_COPMI|nr:hypothetical protein FA13DRAFT_1792164 [Coprinellus micaceus]
MVFLTSPLYALLSFLAATSSLAAPVSTQQQTNWMVVLGYWSPESDGEHLDYEHPLASGFSLADGEVEVEIPADVESGENYFIVLFGDSGNVSPNFTIDQIL